MLAIGSIKSRGQLHVIQFEQISFINSRHRELSVVTEIGAKRVPLLRREPRFTPFSLQANTDPYDITSRDHLQISYT